MRWPLTVALAISALAPSCVSVHRSSGRPAAQFLGSPEGHPPSLEAERHFTTFTVQDVARVRNITYFDLANCFPPSPLVTEVFSDEQLLGALVTARPAVLECLVAPSRRGEREQTFVTATAVARPGAGLEVAVSGDNLTPEGQQCALEALRSTLAALPPLPEGWPPAAAQVELVHERRTLPAVTFGANLLSDAAGQIRLAMPSFCPCFQPWREAAPREIEVLVTLQRPWGRGKTGRRTPSAPAPVRPWSVHLPEGLAPADAQVAACLQERLASMEFQAPALEVDVPFYFQLIDSRRDGLLPGLPAWLQHKQLEAVRNRRVAEMLVALGARSTAARAYDALVRRYQRDRSIKVEAVSQSCQGLLRKDDAWGEALERKLEVERLALATACHLDQDEPREAVASQVADTERSLASAAEVRQVDERACPRKTRAASPPRLPAPRRTTPYWP